MTTPYYDNRQQQSGGQSFNTFGQEFDGQQSFNNYGYGGDQQDAHQRVGYPYLPSPDPNAASSTNSPFPPQNNQQFMYDPLFNTARHLGGQFAEQQRQKDWTNKLSHEKPMTPQEDVNAPDLYIPVMAFITYILVAGFVFGVQKRFTPEKLGMLTTNALFYMVLENLIVFVMKYALNISQSLNIWHALAYSSYKFTGMVVCLLLYLIGGKKVYYFALVYFILSTVFFLLRSLKTFILDMGWSPESGRKRKVYLLLSITAFQSLIMWLLTNSVTNYMPANYDFAKLAMSGMGLAATNGNNGVPLTADGDVDYEALLKMP